jgi:DNA-directed RNA polymerase sigma subunit (sigma70/sigma32)
MRSPLYGKLNILSLHTEVRTIWYTKDDELRDLPDLDLKTCGTTGFNCVENKMILDFLYNESNISNREKQVFYMRFVLEMTLDEIGEKMFVSRERIRQIEGRLVRRIKDVADRHNIVKWGDCYAFH